MAHRNAFGEPLSFGLASHNFVNHQWVEQGSYVAQVASFAFGYFAQDAAQPGSTCEPNARASG